MHFDSAALFSTLFPGLFMDEHIRSLSPEEIYEEQSLNLHSFSPDVLSISCPAHITFGMYQGDMASLHAAVRSVDESWIPFFTPGQEVFCAFDGDQIVSFCLIDDFGTYKGLRIGGPGCVGTVPRYRRRGIGLKMVQKATAILRERGYDLSYIHYTCVGHWYARLGYQTLLKWNVHGVSH